jgi:hypothetical protein
MQISVHKSHFRGRAVRSRAIFTLVLGLCALLSAGLRAAHAQAGPAWVQGISSSASASAQALAPAPQPGQDPVSMGAAKPAGGPHDGIAVHGRWKIFVRNRDGSLAQHLEFENSLTAFGQALLDFLLMGDYTIVGYGVDVSGAGGQPGLATIPSESGEPYHLLGLRPFGPCGTLSGTGTDCILTATSNPYYDTCVAIARAGLQNYTEAACVPGLSISRTSDAAVVLQGTIEAGENSTIKSVSTFFTVCDLTQFPLASCGKLKTPVPEANPNIRPQLFTSYEIPKQAGQKDGGISIQKGQTAEISVTLSFTSAAQ